MQTSCRVLVGKTSCRVLVGANVEVSGKLFKAEPTVELVFCIRQIKIFLHQVVAQVVVESTACYKAAPRVGWPMCKVGKLCAEAAQCRRQTRERTTACYGAVLV